MAKTQSTPGVYIEEINDFPKAVVPVPTAVPAFIGYTEKAERGEESLRLVPTKINSMAEFERLFGGAPATTFTLSNSDEAGVPYKLAVKDYFFTLYRQLRIFYENGGSSCYIVSVGGYSTEDGNPAVISLETLQSGLAPLRKEKEPTMLLIPEAVHAPVRANHSNEDQKATYQLQQQMLSHCGGDTKSRFAILDVRMDGASSEDPFYNIEPDITRFRKGIGSENLDWGAAYFPWLHTTAVTKDEVGPDNLDAASEIRPGPADALYATAMNDIRKYLNLLPPSAAMAGVYSMVDNSVGVFKSPANVRIGSVMAPAIEINNSDQKDMNVPFDGKSINAIRSFPGQGVLVWGARTLDGNSLDWRYISVRRTVIFIEQSITNTVESCAFSPNSAETWTSIKTSISVFLTNFWKAGGLAGATPEQSFSVDVGLGSTMTATDILEGIMRITVKVAITHPAEYIALNFQQKMSEA
ncbi:phage tail sheath family protein [Neolewinella aurantiaca]|uniref:Phage tail sheath family protein n=2 Tax=Neolewinella aurantiaca TaxID=2602767 RepID=A0A5C7FB75_9BACT|nr:phage tail sheath family protein [Neolewinella aurantiaca]